jgi:multidrug transporter EmrE-like cation transporter
MKGRAAVLPPARGPGAIRSIARWLRDPVWLCGLGVQTGGYALYVVSLADAPVSLVAVMMQGGIALFVVFAVVFLHERAEPREWAGIAGILGAMVILALSLEAGVAEAPPSLRALLELTALASIIAALPGGFVRLRLNGVAAAVASGIAFGMASLFTKALTHSFLAEAGTSLFLRVFANPWTYAASAANIAGLVMLQNSFCAARGIIAMPLSSACSNIVPIAGGMIVFGESLPADPIAAALRLGAFAMTIFASAMLASTDEVRAADFSS